MRKKAGRGLRLTAKRKGSNINSIDRKDLLDKVRGKQCSEGREAEWWAEILGTEGSSECKGPVADRGCDCFRNSREAAELEQSERGRV